jgi:hypothetical protein
LFAPGDGEKLVRVTYDAGIGLFLAGGNAGSVYINFSPDFMAKVWQSPSLGLVTAIVSDPAAPANYFVSLGNARPTAEIFEIHSSGPLHFDGTDITANLPAVVVMTLVTNPNEPGVLYAGTKGQGVFRGVKDNSGNWTWQAFNNGMPAGANVTKLRYDPQSGTIFASTFGRGEFALSTVVIF